MKSYKYIGEGAGIPGFAHEMHEEQIVGFSDEQLRIWREALASGVYVEIQDGGRTATQSAPRIETTSTNRKTKKADDITAEGD